MKKILVILILISSVCNGQTTFYLDDVTAADVSPTFSATWNVTTTAQRRKMETSKDGSTITSRTGDAVGAASPRFVLTRQYVSVALSAQTIDFTTNNLTCNLRGNISSTAAGTGGDQFYIVRKCANDGSSPTGDITMEEGTGYTTTLTNRTTFLGASTLTLSANDRLIIEVGWKYTTGSNTSRTATQSFGSSSGTDLPDDDATTTANNPVFKFSQTLTFPTVTPVRHMLPLLQTGGEPKPEPEPKPLPKPLPVPEKILVPFIEPEKVQATVSRN